MFWQNEVGKKREAARKTRELEASTVPVLMEIVSARDLSHRKSMDPYCIVRCGITEVHRTKTIYNDPDPIWTVLTGSLCLLRIPNENNVSEESTEGLSVVVEVCEGLKCVGVVAVPYPDVLKATGKREERALQIRVGRGSSKDDDRLGATLALRFRRATREDISFFRKSRALQTSEIRASDINFKRSERKSLIKSYTKVGKNKKVMYRVLPGPDPDRKEETEWMTKDDIMGEALKPSKKWAEVGSGGVGRIYVEIIGCDKLPNLDIGVHDKTDPFVGIVFEDTMVRTDIIHDTLTPRWMPWSARAFAFNVSHPSSLLLLGVFDYDEAPLDDHDPVGRVFVNTANFQSHTSYVLHYALHGDPHMRDNCGRITIRLRVEWKSESKARKMALNTVPPRFLINLENQKAFNCVRYICRGKVNMDQATMETCKLYANEVMSYGPVVCYILDVILGVLLWRGRANIRFLRWKLNIWFPIHSIVLLASVIVAIEIPFLVPTVLLYDLAWIFLAINYHGSRYPYPWNQCKTFNETNTVLLLGRSVHPPIYIERNVGVREAKQLEQLDKAKADRVAGFLMEAKTIGLKAQKIYNKTSIKSISIQTEDKGSWSLLSNQLVPVHVALQTVCEFLRKFRNLMNWKGYYAHSITMYSLFLGSAWLLLPLHILVLWICRIIAWTFLGPWMKLVDVFWVHKYYRTREELEADPKYHGGNNLDWILTSESIKKAGHSARLASEEALKLKDMRQYKFGKLSQLVPPVDTSRYPCIPLPQSTAQPYLGAKQSSGANRKGFVDVSPESQRWIYVEGQKLEGHMIQTIKRPINTEYDEIS